MKIHPNDLTLEELLLAVGSDHQSVLDHLIRCESCRRRVQELRLRPTLTTGDFDPYAEALDRSEPWADAHSRALARERSQAPALFVEITGYGVTQRDLIVRNDPRFRTWGLFELLIERALETAIRDSGYAEELGILALRLSDQLDPQVYDARLIEDYRGRAWAHIGNARRLRSDLRGADEAFEKGDAYLRKGTQESVERAIFLDLNASLRRDQRRFDEATRLLRRAVPIFLQHGHRHRAGRSLVNLSIVYHYAGQPEEGIPMLHKALELIDPEQEPRLLLCARHNLIDYLASAGRFLEAQGLYRETRPLYRDFPDPWAQNRRKWVRGKIARGIGQARLAESLFLAARDGFVGEGIPYDTALVSLELASLYAEQGRTTDLKRLAKEMLPIFSSLQIHREALAALAFLRQAIETEKASLEMVTGVAAYLRRARHNPELRFTPGVETPG
ncbi:MAG TPA: tetratricopeptide repeat protein [Thermoanaerobaculia bacterium]|nr:tetratricopeptide repeat protein [Thermoanaerobaculia bacterium]